MKLFSVIPALCVAVVLAGCQTATTGTGGGATASTGLQPAALAQTGAEPIIGTWKAPNGAGGDVVVTTQGLAFTGGTSFNEPGGFIGQQPSIKDGRLVLPTEFDFGLKAGGRVRTTARATLQPDGSYAVLREDGARFTIRIPS